MSHQICTQLTFLDIVGCQKQANSALRHLSCAFFSLVFIRCIYV